MTEVIEVSGSWMQDIDWPTVPADVRAQSRALLDQSDALVDAGDIDGGIAKQDEAKGVLEPYKKKKKDDKKDTPPPTAPSPAPPELIPDTDEAIAVSTSPDVVKVGDKPVPFPVNGKGGDDQNYSPDVKSNGKVIKRRDSKMTTTYGAEPGDAGVKSGTEGQKVEPVTSSPIVRANGIPVQRHADKCTLNNGNCPGEYVHVKSTDTHKAPDGNDEQDKKKDTRNQAQKGWDGLYNNSDELKAIDAGLNRAGDYIGNPSLIGQDLGAAYDSLPTAGEALEFGQNVASGVASGAEYVWNNPGATASGAYNWAANGLSGLWSGVSGAYNEGGVSQAGGHLLASGISAFNPFKKAKWAGRAAESLEDLGDAAKAERLAEEAREAREAAEKAKKAKEAEDAAEKPKRAEEDGEPGARSTRRNPCLKLSKGNPDGKGEFRGGSYGGTKGVGDKGMESNHMPPKSVSPLGETPSPSMQMDKPDHRIAMSTGSSLESQEWRQFQQDLINQGRYRDALAMDIKDVRRIAAEGGNIRKYNEATRELLAYYKCLVKHGWLPPG